jgi:2-polyprenyl-3-methyl-5-hydroxy-6-metoxy-1,4-benzoquinol methylase
MGMMHTRDLDAFVAEIDRLGGFEHGDAKSYLADFRLDFDAQVNPQLDPFSDEYFQQQLALYRELAGRALDQQTGELMSLNVDAHVAGNNPYNSADIRFMSKHTRTIHTCLMIANLAPGAKVLDMGSGWGLSSEALAFCGATVTAVDINPLFVELVRRRAERLHLPIESINAGFDTFTSSDKFDLLLFYECLHHSVKPWETLSHLGQFVKADGKIIFAGEPINRFWWPHWGLRLDPGSVYCLRKFGWWENGWTVEFITRCFERAGFDLAVHPHIGLDNGLIGVAVRKGAAHLAQVDLNVLEPYHASTSLQPFLARLQSSRYWPLTAPLRFLFRKLRPHLKV